METLACWPRQPSPRRPGYIWRTHDHVTRKSGSLTMNFAYNFATVAVDVCVLPRKSQKSPLGSGAGKNASSMHWANAMITYHNHNHNHTLWVIQYIDKKILIYDYNPADGGRTREMSTIHEKVWKLAKSHHRENHSPRGKFWYNVDFWSGTLGRPNLGFIHYPSTQTSSGYFGSIMEPYTSCQFPCRHRPRTVGLSLWASFSVGVG